MNWFRHLVPELRRLAWALGAVLTLSPGTAGAAALEIDHVEPPNWWVGMKDSRLEIMMHGAGIAAWRASLSRQDVRLVKTERSSNPNYLWLSLRIGAHAHAGPMTIRLQRGADSKDVRYELRTRAAGSAQRQGFGPADVVLNLMPDRFANGNPDNDVVAGFADTVDRRVDGARHGGDIQGIIDHLDYVASMGYTAIWPTPMTQSNQPSFSYHGYAATDTYRIDPRFGTNEDYVRLVSAARLKGLKVLQDIVPNHVGSNHWWMRDLPALDWFSNHDQFVLTNHARTTVSDPYASQVDRELFIHGWFDPAMPDMNQDNPHVAMYEIQNAIWWIETAGLAGLRVDTYSYSDKAFMATWCRRILDEYPRLNIVGEEWSTNPAVQSYWARGRTQSDGYASTLPGVMDYVLQSQLVRALTEPEGNGTGFARLYDALVEDRLYANPERMMLFDGNHDNPRIYSALGNDPALVRMAVAYVLTMKRTPQIYYGTEVLMSSPARQDAFDAFRADFPGGWAGDTVNAFTGAGLTTEQLQMQAWMRKLLNWRRHQPIIHSGRLKHFMPEGGVYVLFRYDASGTVMVVFNKSNAAASLDMARFQEVLPIGASVTDVLGGKSSTIGRRLVVEPRSVSIFQTEGSAGAGRPRLQ